MSSNVLIKNIYMVLFKINTIKNVKRRKHINIENFGEAKKQIKYHLSEKERYFIRRIQDKTRLKLLFLAYRKKIMLHKHLIKFQL